MGKDIYRPIPGYDKYGVSKDGVIISFERDLILTQYLLNGYYIVDTFRGSLTETLPVHRAVALAWITNTDPSKGVVNHIDGVPTNNHYSNLEWTTVSGNNYHAVNTGLRSDNIDCMIRNFFDGTITIFPSISQACEYMGMRNDTPPERLKPKMFGKLLMDKYEFRYLSDPTPWFYLNRRELVKPSRYMVTVTGGTELEIFSTKELLKTLQLYDCKDRSIPCLVEYAKKKYPALSFEVRDSYMEDKYVQRRATAKSKRIPILAMCGNVKKTFQSLTQCAKYFKVDRSSIINRLDKAKDLNGWTFTNCPS